MATWWVRLFQKRVMFAAVAAIALWVLAIPLAKPLAAQTHPRPTADHGYGRESFESNCSMCHGLDGRGSGHAPNIATNSAVARLSDSALRHIIENGIPSAGMPSFRELGSGKVGAVLAWLRILQGVQASQSAFGNPVAGKRLFFGVAGCSSCHMIRGVGGFMGPDLTDYSLTHLPHVIVEAIIKPNAHLAPGGRVVVVVTRDGRRFTGVARNEDDFSLQLQTPDGAFHLFMKSTLASVRHEPRSLMPADYSRRLSSAEIDDLVSFIEKSGEDASEPGMSKGAR